MRENTGKNFWTPFFPGWGRWLGSGMAMFRRTDRPGSGMYKSGPQALIFDDYFSADRHKRRRKLNGFWRRVKDAFLSRGGTDLAESARRFLRKDAAIDTSRIEVEARGRFLLVKGSVPNAPMKQRVATRLKQLPGLELIRNDLHVHEEAAHLPQVGLPRVSA